MKKLLRLIVGTSFLNIPIQYVLVPIASHKKKLIELLRGIDYNKALDYGCGEGMFCKCFTASRYHGFDIDEERINYAKNKYKDHGFSNDIPSLAAYDLIFFNNFLHHIDEKNIELLFNEISKTKKTNTHIVIIELLPIVEQRNFLFKMILKLEAYTHYSNPRSLEYYRSVLQQNGFREQSVDVMHRFFIAHYS